MSYLTKLLVCLPLVAVVGSVGCATEMDEDDTGLSSDEEVADATEALVTPSCALSRNKILSSVSGGRKRAIERGFNWYDAKVSYSQSRTYGGYRTDCSGFVSMAWETGTSYTTANYITGGEKSFLLGSYDALEPGDALVHRRNGSGHMVLFVGWDNAAHTKACVLEQNSTADDMQWGTRSVTSLKNSNYKAVRADKFR